MTPRWNPSKCVITLNDAMVCTNDRISPAHERSVTGVKPASIRKRQIITETMKLITWLRVIADVMQLIAR